ncbi:hypothetical protein J4Q44_G00252220 [Coregonus suidteri]|uniref:VWFA domain-containing protein n=1 Tax=Coregonus suidteri TaxID=861788 RepID=A0AAN8LNE4_9TELE
MGCVRKTRSRPGSLRHPHLHLQLLHPGCDHMVFLRVHHSGGQQQPHVQQRGRGQQETETDGAQYNNSVSDPVFSLPAGLVSLCGHLNVVCLGSPGASSPQHPKSASFYNPFIYLGMRSKFRHNLRALFWSLHPHPDHSHMLDEVQLNLDIMGEVSAQIATAALPASGPDFQMEIALLLDSSNNVGERRFNLQKNFISKLAVMLRIGRNRPHLGVVQAR